MKYHLTQGLGARSLCGQSSGEDLLRAEQFDATVSTQLCRRCVKIRGPQQAPQPKLPPLTPLQQAILFLATTVDQRKRELAQWETRYRDNPLDAFRWGDSAITAAADFQLAREVLAFLRGEVNPDFEGDRLQCVKEEFTRDVLQMARDQAWRSSSMMSNRTEEAARIAKAKFLDRLGRWT